VYLGLPDPTPERPADEVALERIQEELKAGREVTLVGADGEPAWFRWRTSAQMGQQWLGADGTFTAHSPSLGLLELLPDAPPGGYRFAAQVRHLQTERSGRAGVFFVRNTFASGRGEIQSFAEVSFNDVLRPAEEMGAGGNLPVPPAENAVRAAGIFSFTGPRGQPAEWDVWVAGGPKFVAAGERRTGWHTIEIDVTPEGVTVRWDGQPFSISGKDIQTDTDKHAGRLRSEFPADPVAEQFRPKFDGRGGLGLYVRRGAASFRAVTVTPLTKKP
jgi:hypothetical protein